MPASGATTEERFEVRRKVFYSFPDLDEAIVMTQAPEDIAPLIIDSTVSHFRDNKYVEIGGSVLPNGVYISTFRRPARNEDNQDA